MINRREFIAGVSSFALVPALTFASNTNGLTYDELVLQTYKHSQQPIVNNSEILRELVRYGTMAANSHNTQPWKFKLTNHEIHIVPDFSRRCPAVDPDDHHLFASLGCAAENILIAAQTFGLYGNLQFDESRESVIISFDKSKAKTAAAFEAIPQRQCTRAVFNGSKVISSTLNNVVTYANSTDIDIHLLTTDESKNVMTEYVVEGNSVQMDDEAFVDELQDWIRFSEADALQLRDGLTYRSTGSPSVPNWMGDLLFKLMYRKKPENDKYREQIASSAGIVVFSCTNQTKAAWVSVGRAYQRFALQSTAHGIRHSFINQPIEVPKLRPQLASYLELGNKLPDLIIRFGYGDPTPRTLRRPVDQVII